MLHSNRFFRLAPLLLTGLFAATLLSACTSRSMLRMDGRYEKARLPNHFDREIDSNSTVFTVTASRTQKEWVAWQDTGSRGGLVDYSFSNAGYGVDLSFLKEHKEAFYGGYLGVSPRPGNVRAGGFLGTSQRSGIFVGSLSLGAGFNISQVNAHYEDIEWVLFFPVSSVEDSVKGSYASVEIPFRAGLLFDLGSVSPYVSGAFNYMGIGFGEEKEPLISGEAGVGVEFRLGPGMRLRAEATAANSAIREHWTGPRYGARVDLARAF